MLKPIFIDTGFVIALINQHDDYHPTAQKLSESYAVHPFITTDAVLMEIGNALARNFKSQGIAIIQYFLESSEVDVIHTNPVLFQKAFELYNAYTDKSWGLTDCLSFVVMREMQITDALTFDQHFTQAGFRQLSLDA
ncbi:MAG: PIN domain-containing protein [Myxococcota bacterium]